VVSVLVLVTTEILPMCKLLRSEFVKISRSEEKEHEFTRISRHYTVTGVTPITGQSTGPTHKLALPFLIHTSAHRTEVQT
jgi:hypothetical protein